MRKLKTKTVFNEKALNIFFKSTPITYIPSTLESVILENDGGMIFKINMLCDHLAPNDMMRNMMNEFLRYDLNNSRYETVNLFSLNDNTTLTALLQLPSFIEFAKYNSSGCTNVKNYSVHFKDPGMYLLEDGITEAIHVGKTLEGQLRVIFNNYLI